jgi:hypothetical protein
METIILDIKTADGKIIPIEFDHEALLQHRDRVAEALSIMRAGPRLQVV